MEKKLSIVKKIKEVIKNKKLNNNKGFSLIELLIVIAIMGVLAVIAFNMFGGVLTNSKKRADDQQAQNIAKAIMAYCIDSGDWDLNQGVLEDGSTKISYGTDMKLIECLMNKITLNGKEYGPILTMKNPDAALKQADPENLDQYMPQWGKTKGGKYEGWQIRIYKDSQSVSVKPTEIAADVGVTIS